MHTKHANFKLGVQFPLKGLLLLFFLNRNMGNVFCSKTVMVTRNFDWNLATFKIQKVKYNFLCKVITCCLISNIPCVHLAQIIPRQFLKSAVCKYPITVIKSDIQFVDKALPLNVKPHVWKSYEKWPRYKTRNMPNAFTKSCTFENSMDSVQAHSSVTFVTKKVDNFTFEWLQLLVQTWFLIDNSAACSSQDIQVFEN